MPKVTPLVSSRAQIRVKTKYCGYQEREGFLRSWGLEEALEVSRKLQGQKMRQHGKGTEVGGVPEASSFG